MRKFIKFISIIIFLFIIIIFSLEYVFKNYTNNIDQTFNNYYNNKSKVECVLIGNSHIQALQNPNLNKMKSFNFSFGGQDLFHINSIIKTICKKKNNLKFILIGVDYDLLGYNYKTANTIWKDRHYYNSTGELYDSTYINKLLAKSNFFNANRDFSKLFMHNIKKSNNHVIPKLTSNTSCHKRAKEHSQIKFDTELIDENLTYLNEITQTILKENINFIFITTPKSKCYRDNYLNENMLKCKDILNNFCNVNNINYYDFFDDSVFSNSDFADYDHLNEKGTKKLFKKIKEKLI